MKEDRFEMLKRHNSEAFEEAVKEGKADKRMYSICRYFNSHEDFFTSSSCAGRIVLLSVESIGKKQPKAFHRKWHRKVKLEEIEEGVEAKAKEKELWFKLDPFILHVGARDLEHARKILLCMRKAGVKRGGIILAKREKFLVEFHGTHVMALPIKSNGNLLVEKEYLSFLVEKANKKLSDNYARLKLFEQVCRKELK